MFTNLKHVDAVRIGRAQIWAQLVILVPLASLAVNCDILGKGETSTAPCGEQMEGNWEVEEGIDSQELALEWGVSRGSACQANREVIDESFRISLVSTKSALRTIPSLISL